MTKQGFFSRNSLLSQWLILIGALLMVGGMLGVNIYIEHHRTGLREQDRLLAQVTVIQKNLMQNLASVNQVLTALQRESSPEINRKKISGERLEILVNAMPGVRTLAILDAEGTILSTNRPELAGKNFKHRDYFRTPQKNPDPDTLFISSPFKTSLGVFAINVVRVIPGPQGRFAGIVSATLNPEYFKTLLSSVLYAPDMWSFIVHQDGTLFMITPERQGVPGKNLAKPGTLFTKHLRSGLESTIETGTVYATGERRMSAWHTIRADNLKIDNSMVVAVGRDLHALYDVWRHDALVQCGLFTLLTLISSLGLYAYQLRQAEFRRHAAESAAALKESAERLQLATEAADLGVWDYTPGTGLLVWDNAMLAIFGIDRAAFSGSQETWRSMVLPDDLPDTETALQTAISGGAPFNTLFRIRRGDGEIRTIRALAKVHLASEDNPIRIIGINEDVTERMQVEEELRAAKEAAEAATRSKSEFLATMSHEIRTPMNAISGMAYLALQTKLDLKQRDYLGKILAHTELLRGVVNDVLDFSKIEANKLELELVNFSLPDTLEQVRDVISAAAEDKGLEIVFSIGAGVPACLKGDPLRLRQILSNLVSNAVKFTKKGSVITEVKLSGASSGSKVPLLFSVSDSGIGMDKAQLEQVFSPFTQADSSISRRYGGTGLGLTIARRLVELMGGTLQATSEIGKGSCFSFRIDLETAPAWDTDSNHLEHRIRKAGTSFPELPSGVGIPDTANETHSTGTGPAMDAATTAQLASLLSRLKYLLTNHDLEAVDFLEQLQPFSDSLVEYENLRRQVARLDFKNALLTLEIIAKNVVLV